MQQDMAQSPRDEERRREFGLVLHDEWLSSGHLGRNWCLQTPYYARKDYPYALLHRRGDFRSEAQVRM